MKMTVELTIDVFVEGNHIGIDPDKPEGNEYEQAMLKSHALSMVKSAIDDYSYADRIEELLSNVWIGFDDAKEIGL